MAGGARGEKPWRVKNKRQNGSSDSNGIYIPRAAAAGATPLLPLFPPFYALQPVPLDPPWVQNSLLPLYNFKLSRYEVFQRELSHSISILSLFLYI